MHATGKIIGKIYLKSTRDTFFFQHMDCNQGRDRGNQFFGGWRYPTEGESSNFWTYRETPHPTISYLRGTSWSPHKENPEEGVWSVYYNDFEKSEWWHSIYWRLFTHFKIIKTTWFLSYCLLVRGGIQLGEYKGRECNSRR